MIKQLKQSSESFKSCIAFGREIAHDMWKDLNIFGKIILSPVFAIWWGCIIFIAILSYVVTLGFK
jgi:hypothetical protein